MWADTELSKMLKIDYPIIQAPMAGGPTTPELVAAVSNAGGLGSLGAGYLTPKQIREAIRDIRNRTNRPFAVNLFIPGPVEVNPEQISRVNQYLAPYREQRGMEPEPKVKTFAESFEEQVNIVLEEEVPVFSFTFGLLSKKLIRMMKEKGIILIGTATTVREAVQLRESGVDAIVAQGSEAGGHRGTFAGSYRQALIGTMALVPQIVDQVDIPVIAAGGIADSRGIVASLALGAAGVQLGTAFLPCVESGAHVQHKKMILNSTEESTVVTRSLTGKAARGIRNTMVEVMEKLDEQDIPDYPVLNGLTRDLRQEAARQNNPEWMSLWAGQATRLCSSVTAGELMEKLVSGVTTILRQLKDE
ncbi:MULTISPECIES: nitronate monooxygenase family protein [unclassified Thermoactinomyces]|jgi:nitronate monooxygenase|uniref:NAD(P)H-dependent flavin oxidoreductase n=1 Tax=unclassified Thermoactinomyces TaxID=2634588 RepID=UPI0018DDBDE8|nr:MULTISPECIES: nitronate monooxygenase [unclassified Thermoactinomyces]MBH8599228.1 nitronate monooxygenase [Thermoactinomyces sp. CICC 10523]MBH8605570.1 nitronate monooxygenase [Thermoactinomyces sp. CICC 10522]MBH8609003.1 nitronate monooxygenase [Thermoactinomyces sp. CICC 10521]